MFPFLASQLTRFWGPFRLLDSRMFLILLGVLLCSVLTWILLPRLWDHLPHDRGKNFVAGSEKAKGKPTGAGLIVVLIFLGCAFLVMPFYLEYALIGICLLLTMLSGYLDDRSTNCWGELKKGIIDLVIAASAAAVLARWQGTAVWLPFIKGSLPGGAFLMPAWLYIIMGTAILWLMINVVNCSDGVDGVAGSQILLGLLTMGAFLYGTVGHSVVSTYLLLPLVENGASWSIVMFTAAAGLAAYLWYNAHPSLVLMGDAGSRFYGMLLGIAVLVSGNPFMFLAAAPILFVNGGAGLVKLVILRILKKCGFDTRPHLRNFSNVLHPENFATDEEAARQIWIVRILHGYRFPVHDHCRRKLGWSDPQVLVRFMLLQLAIVPTVIVLLLKLR